MLTALKTERNDTIEVFFHSYMVSLHSHSSFLVQVAEAFRKPMPGLSDSEWEGYTVLFQHFSLTHNHGSNQKHFFLDKHLGLSAEYWLFTF